MKTKVQNSKQTIEKEYNVLISDLIKAKSELISLIANNTKLKNIKDVFVNNIEANVLSSQELMKETLDGMVWDNLVIAFFGETNAGKSTIIETMRILFDDERKQKLKKTGKSEDGRIVGDGQADFTKVYDEYKLNVYGKTVTLIDVPGIEGKEEDFIDDIKRALKQAHIVFYVQGHNKKPDVATAEKIKRYLNDWVNVYSIYNVRGGASNYDEDEERVNLYTTDVDKTYLLIEETFKGILHDVYKGNIAIQALLAMCSVAQFAPERCDLEVTQLKLEKYFGNKKAVYAFSHFEEIVKLVRNKTEHFEEEILAANKQKLKAQYNKILRLIADGIELQRNDMDLLLGALKTYKNDVRNIFNETETKLNRQTNSIIDSEFALLLNEVCEAIDFTDRDELESQIRQISQSHGYSLSNKINKVISEISNSHNTRLKDRQKRLIDIYRSNNLHQNAYFQPLNMNFDINVIFKELDFGSEDVIKEAGNFFAIAASGAATGGAIGMLGGPAGAAIGAATGAGLAILSKGVVDLISGFLGEDKAKEDAKSKAKQQIDNIKNKAKNNMSSMIENICSQLDRMQGAIEVKIKNDISNLKEMLSILMEVCENLKNKK